MAKAVTVRLSPEEREQAEARVLVPETHTQRVRIGEHDVTLKPLNIGPAKRVKALLDPVALANEKATGTEQIQTAIEETQDAFTRVLCYLGQVYNVPLNAEWIEEHLDAPTVRRIVEAQLDLSRDNDHLLFSLRQGSSFLAGITAAQKAMLQAVQTAVKAASTPASAKPGTSDSPSSSSATPAGS